MLQEIIRFQKQSNRPERIHRHTLHFGYIEVLPEVADFSNNPTALSAFTGIRCTLVNQSAPRDHRLQKQPNRHERIHRYTLHSGHIEVLLEIADFSNNPTVLSAFTGIRCTWRRDPRMRASIHQRFLQTSSHKFVGIHGTSRKYESRSMHDNYDTWTRVPAYTLRFGWNSTSGGDFIFSPAAAYTLQSLALLRNRGGLRASTCTLTSECHGYSQNNVYVKSDSLFLTRLGLPPAKLVWICDLVRG